ncbi:MAG: hypothetical protein HXX09_10980 [Bacteroidetes bacterium]|nr:hypothetical protein [Bacteroidota bacterium]
MKNKNITLGVNFAGHDASYTLLDSSGIPIIIAEEERYSRIKKGEFVPNPQIIFSIIEEAGLLPEDIKFLSIANIQEFIENRPEQTLIEYIPFGNAKIYDALFKSIIKKLPNVVSVNYLKHHLCHAASAFYPSPFINAAVLTVDGMGEDETVNIWYGKKNELHKVFSIPHPHSIGYLFQVISKWMGLTGGEREGKLMGLASYGKPIYKNLFYENFIQIDEYKGFIINPNLEKYPCTNESWIKYCEIFFGERNSSGIINEYHKNIAASVQEVLEEVLLNLLKIAKNLTKAKYCCLAGGVFMSSMANGKLRRENIFQDVWVQPLASDNGLSLGAALWSYYYGRNERKRWEMQHPFWGTEITGNDIEVFIKKNKITCYKSDNIEFEAAKFLSSGKLIGWVQGRSEIGARALGHRSIFADPRDYNSKNKMNLLIKQREDWRPFAPIVLEEDLSNYFDDDKPSPFMMFVSNAKQNCPLPAALHIDNTGRVQTINKNFDSRVYNLICEFKKITGVGGLLNTSFNLRGEPIVRTIEQAYDDFIKSGMDVLVMNDYVFQKPTDYVWIGDPPIAKLPPINFCNKIANLLISEVKNIALITYGNEKLLIEMAEYIKLNNSDTIIKTFQLFTEKNSFISKFDKLMSYDSKEVTSIEKILDFDLVFLLIPTWVDIAFEMIPNLLSPFTNMVIKNLATNIFIIDSSGNLGDFLGILPISNKEWMYNGCLITEIERFWFNKNKS